MSSPQKENGYTTIANEVMESLVAVPLSGLEFRLILFIIRKTYGYHKKEDAISLSQFVEATGAERKSIVRKLKNLEELGVILVNRDRYITRYGYNKKYMQWGSVHIDTTSVQMDTKTSVQMVPKLVSKWTHTKEILQKIRNKSFMKNFEEEVIDYDTNERQETESEKRNKVLKSYYDLMDLFDKKQGSRFNQGNRSRHIKALDKIRESGFNYSDVVNKFYELREDKWWKDKGITFEAIHKQLEVKPPRRK